MTRVLLSIEQARVWRQNRDMLRAACINVRCKCGSRLAIKAIRRDGLLKRCDAFCPKMQWWNFWKHDPDRTVTEY